MKITFLGAVQQVTGSRYLVEHEDTKILVDCGMFQGPPETARRNLDPFPVDPATIDAIVLTHAHIDHTGYIPAFVKNGFQGKIYCSKGTYELCALMLIDSGRLQEGDAMRANVRGGPNHPPAIALYTQADAEQSLHFFKTIDYEKTVAIGSLKVTLIRSGHILGSAFVIITDGERTLTFSGDLGRPQQLIMKAPPAITKTDYLVLESTYGARQHEKTDPIQTIEHVVNQTVTRGGVVIIPCFAVGRTETILYCLYQLKQKKAIPNVPIFLDSPLAIKATDLLCDFQQEYSLSAAICRDVLKVATRTMTAEESKKIDRITQPAIIIAGSGMADGGRVLFHLKQFIGDEKNTVLFVGYQAEGTAGHELVSGAKTVKLHDESYAVRAHIKALDTLSAHADADEIIAWLEHLENEPKQIFLTHGDQESAQALKKKIEKRFAWSVAIPKYKESFDLE